jgi:hypothetical protein
LDTKKNNNTKIDQNQKHKNENSENKNFHKIREGAANLQNG